MECIDPGEPANSLRVSMSGLQYGDTVSYEALEGYDPYPHAGALFGECQANAIWSNAYLEIKGMSEHLEYSL